MLANNRIRFQRILREAEGYLELGLPQYALVALDRVGESEAFKGYQLYLRGEALRALGRYQEAIEPLERAADIAPDHIENWIALAWCRKRTGRLDLAIEALERAHDEAPDQALVHYNLACYWSLAGNKQHALAYLARAFALDPDYRDLVSQEPDFDSLRSDPDFQHVTSVIV